MKSLPRSLHDNLVLLFLIIFFYIAYFSPIIFTDRLLASGDGLSYYLPNFYSGITLWEPLVASGFPFSADPQAMTWYPLSILLLLTSKSWNLFVILAYILATYFTYQYVYFITKSFLGGIVSGVTFGLSGFMAAHMDHTSIIHSAMWLPLLFLSVEKVRQHNSTGWFAVAAMSFSLCALAGHPQILAYTVLLCACYVIVTGFSSSISIPRMRFYSLFCAIILIGLSLAAIQLIPAFELVELSLRSDLSYSEFTSYSLPINQLFGLIFPFLFGGSPASIYGYEYFGAWNHGELAGYTGLLTLILATVGMLNSKHTVKWFFALTAVGSLLFATGDSTPLAGITYHIPGLNKFRAPARHLLEYTFSVDVLAGLGVAAIEKHVRTSKQLILSLFVCAAAMLAALLAIYFNSNQLKAMALEHGIESISFFPWSNPALGMPTTIFFLSTLAVLLWGIRPYNSWQKIFLIAVLVIDLGSYAWHVSVWHFPATSKRVLQASVWADSYQKRLRPSYQRILPARGWGILTDIPANLSRIWGVASAGFYGPLMISRISHILQMSTTGYIYGWWFDDANQALDILAVKFVTGAESKSEIQPFNGNDGNQWAREDINLKLGSECGNHPLRKEMTFDVHESFDSSGIGLVSYLACSIDVKDQEEVLRITVKDSTGDILTQTVKAGRDTSEWAFDREDVRPSLKQKRAHIFDNYDNGTWKAHRYCTYLPFDMIRSVREVNIEWLGSTGAIIIDKVSLINDKKKQAYPIKRSACKLDGRRWRKYKEEGSTRVYENLRAMPRAWLVPEVVAAKPEEILTAVQTSTLPDGRVFDCSRTALVEKPVRFKLKPFDQTAKAKIINLTNTRVEVLTHTNSPSFLVLSDLYYPGWSVMIDGKRSQLFQTNYILRGVVVPGGKHKVIFTFVPTLLYIGLVISVISALLIALILRKKMRELLSGLHL